MRGLIDLKKYVLLPQRMLYLKEQRALIFSDIHLGVEYAMAQQGLFIPPLQFKEIKDQIQHAVRATRPKKIIIAGDLKHVFERRTPQEHKEVLELLKYLRTFNAEVILVKGNHDTFIRGVLEENKVNIVDYLELGEFIIMHGHKLFDVDFNNKIVISAHIHPTISISDGLARIKVPVFLVSNNRLILPALTPLLTGFDIFRGYVDNEFVSPLLEDIKEYEIYAILTEYKILPLGNIDKLIKIQSQL